MIIGYLLKTLNGQFVSCLDHKHHSFYEVIPDPAKPESGYKTIFTAEEADFHRKNTGEYNSHDLFDLTVHPLFIEDEKTMMCEKSSCIRCGQSYPKDECDPSFMCSTCLREVWFC